MRPLYTFRASESETFDRKHVAKLMYRMSQSSDGAHLPNERVRVLNLDKGINILRRWISGVGEL